MLDHLEHHHVRSLEQLIPLIGTEWTVFHIRGASKPAMYGRMWKIRGLGIDAMVRELDHEYVLIARREVSK